MKFKEHLKYKQLMSVSSSEVRPLLAEIKMIIQTRLNEALSEVKLERVQNLGAIDNNHLLEQKKRSIYFATIDMIVDELNALGHRLLPINHDSDIDFESTSVSWATDFADESPCGLDLEIFPSEVNVLWILS